MLARGTVARNCGLIAEEKGGACDCKIISKYVKMGSQILKVF